MPKNIHYEKLLCSLYVFSRSLEGFLYDTMNNITKIKDKEYARLPLKSIDQIYGVITTNLPDEYVYRLLVYNKDDSIFHTVPNDEDSL